MQWGYLGYLSDEIFEIWGYLPDEMHNFARGW